MIDPVVHPSRRAAPDASREPGRSTGLPGRAGALLVALLPVLASACDTPAQREAARIHTIAASDAPAIDSCWRKALQSPPYRTLRAKLGEQSDSPTAAMKLNPQTGSPQEVAQLLLLRRDYLAPCRVVALESAGKVHPAIVTVLAENYAKADSTYALFAQRTITWGELVTTNQALVTERRARLLATGETLQQKLGSGPATDTADRQRAEAALSAWLQQQRTVLPDQPATDCRFAGAILNCTSS